MIDEFEKALGQKRNNYWNGQWDGNQIKEVIQEKNLKKMEQILPEEVKPFIESFRNLRKISSEFGEGNINLFGRLERLTLLVI